MVSAIGDVLRRCVHGAYGAIATLRNLIVLLALSAATLAQADEVTVAVLGDSLTQGYGLPPEQGLVPQLQDWLDQRGEDAELINAGVSGDTTAGGLSRVDWTLTPEVDALVVALGGNDLLRGLDPATSRKNLDGILRAAETRDVPVLLIGLIAPPNYGPEFKSSFDAIYPDLAERYGALLHPDFLSALTAETDLRTALAEYMQPDGIHPNARGVSLIVDDIGPSVVGLIDRLR